jgi:GMP synthase-like glutamine amidotransferase
MPETGSTSSNNRPGVVLHNEDVAPAALLGDWLRERQIPHRTIRTWESGVPDDPREFAWIAALGSSHSASQSDPAWILAEVDLLRRAVDADVPVLGICFGGQALSVALGGGVADSDQPVWGWFETETEEPDLVPAGPWAHVHEQVFSVPPGATRIATAPAGPDAYRVGPHLGLQFHPEATPAIVDRWAEDEAAKLPELGVDRTALREQGERVATRASAEAFRMFDAWRALAAAPARVR